MSSPLPDIVLRWQFPPAGGDRDMRTFNILLEHTPGVQGVHFYKFLTIPGVAESATTFERFNLSARRWEIAGEIHWTNNFSGQVQFGIHILPLYEIRRRRRQTSRFVAEGSEYRWKVADVGNDLYCVDSQDRTVATWTQGNTTLRVVGSAQPILDRIVVTCLVNLWFRTHGYW